MKRSNRTLVVIFNSIIQSIRSSLFENVFFHSSKNLYISKMLCSVASFEQLSVLRKQLQIILRQTDNSSFYTYCATVECWNIKRKSQTKVVRGYNIVNEPVSETFIRLTTLVYRGIVPARNKSCNFLKLPLAGTVRISGKFYELREEK